MSTQPPDDEKPHIAAIGRAVLGGFKQLYLPALPALVYERRLVDVMETITVQGIQEASAARYRADDYLRRFERATPPLWQTEGSVADVIGLLLELPPPGMPGAPSLASRPSSSLWLPHSRL